MQQADYATKLPKELLLSIINDKNPNASLVDSMVSFGAPTVYAGGNGKNTQITGTALTGSGLVVDSTQDYFYNRLDIASIPGSLSKVFQKGDATKVADLLPEINTRYGINLQTGEYTNSDLPPFEGDIPNEEHDFDLVIDASALVYYGTLSLKVRTDEIALAVVTPNNVLDGFVWTPAV